MSFFLFCSNVGPPYLLYNINRVPPKIRSLRVRQGGCDGRYRSSKSTKQLLPPKVLCVACNTQSAIRGTSSPAKIKDFRGPHKDIY